MAEEPGGFHMEPIEAVQVGSLICTCGMCGAGIVIEFEALDDETGRVDPAHAFDHCPECGCLFDATRATWGAWLEDIGGRM